MWKTQCNRKIKSRKVGNKGKEWLLELHFDVDHMTNVQNFFYWLEALIFLVILVIGESQIGNKE